jgi:hypothetical protein
MARVKSAVDDPVLGIMCAAGTLFNYHRFVLSLRRWRCAKRKLARTAMIRMIRRTQRSALVHEKTLHYSIFP